ncbi:MAG TPA: hypothetical protein VFO41_13205 [Alphaproteobacteria bacterium]|nr:hypothetical protein [Alphaproteobacteria bacterium]
MANDRMQVKLDGRNVAIGVGFVVVSLVLFTWLLPLVLPIALVLVIAGAALGVAAWFLFMLSRG